MDKAAAAFGIDPVEIRRRNLIDKFPYTSATGLDVRRGDLSSRRWRWRSKAIDLPAFRARQKKARAQGRYLGIGFATFSERTGYGSPAFAARGMEITPGWETVHLIDRSVRLCRSAHRRVAARPGPAHDAGADHRRRDRRHAATSSRSMHGDTDRTPYGWGTFASRSLVISGGASADRGAQGARQADQDRQPHAGSRRRRHRAGGRRTPRSPAPTARSPSPRWRARPITRRTASRARSSRA